MAVLWTSGRTSLLLTLAATLTALAVVRGRVAAAAVALAAALFSKEEAVLLPVILAGWLVILRRTDRAPAVTLPAWLATAAVAEALYFTARAMTSAATPWTAAWYYRPTFDPAALLENVLSYADRVGSVPLGVLVLGWIAMGFARPMLTPEARATIACGAAWLIGAFGLTIFGPVRSDLYAVFPSVGVSLAAAAALSAMWFRAPAAAQRRALAGALGLMLAFTVPLVARTRRWSSLAEFSSTILADLAAQTRHLPADATVVIHDDRSHRNNLGSAFGTIFGEAYELKTGRTLSLWIEPALGDVELAGLQRPCEGCVDLELRVVGGRLVGR
jgi:hypothetical protein